MNVNNTLICPICGAYLECASPEMVSLEQGKLVVEYYCCGHRHILTSKLGYDQTMSPIGTDAVATLKGNIIHVTPDTGVTVDNIPFLDKGMEFDADGNLIAYPKSAAEDLF